MLSVNDASFISDMLLKIGIKNMFYTILETNDQ